MPTLNKVELIGHLGSDPEVRYTQAGEPVVTFTMATNESWTDKKGQKQERTDWHHVEAFGKLAEIARDFLKKGRQLYVEGTLRYDEWTDKEGTKRQTTRVRLSGPMARLILLGPRPQDEPQVEDPAA